MVLSCRPALNRARLEAAAIFRYPWNADALKGLVWLCDTLGGLRWRKNSLPWRSLGTREGSTAAAHGAWKVSKCMLLPDAGRDPNRGGHDPTEPSESKIKGTSAQKARNSVSWILATASKPNIRGSARRVTVPSILVSAKRPRPHSLFRRYAAKIRIINVEQTQQANPAKAWHLCQRISRKSIQTDWRMNQGTVKDIAGGAPGAARQAR